MEAALRSKELENVRVTIPPHMFSIDCGKQQDEAQYLDNLALTPALVGDIFSDLLEADHGS